jgi:hypothetical protein
MKHPFQIGDLVVSSLNKRALVTKAYKSSTGLWIDVFWLLGGEEHSVNCPSDFTLVSRAEQ